VDYVDTCDTEAPSDEDYPIPDEYEDGSPIPAASAVLAPAPAPGPAGTEESRAAAAKRACLKDDCCAFCGPGGCPSPSPPPPPAAPPPCGEAPCPQASPANPRGTGADGVPFRRQCARGGCVGRGARCHGGLLRNRHCCRAGLKCAVWSRSNGKCVPVGVTKRQLFNRGWRAVKFVGC
jgi:hypothetical protein